MSSWIYFIITAESKAQKRQHKLQSLTAASVLPSHTAEAQGCGAAFQAVGGQSNQGQREQLSLGLILSSCIGPAAGTSPVFSDFDFVRISFQATCLYVTVADKSFPANHLEFKKTG